MAFNYPNSGLNNVAEYMASGLPWVTSSTVTDTPIRIDFPMVTNQITFKANGGTIRFGFTRLGVNGSNFFTLTPSSSITMDIRVKQVWIRSSPVGTGSYEIFAGLTGIPWKGMPVLTASAVYNGNTSSMTPEYGYGIPGTPGVGTGLG